MTLDVDALFTKLSQRTESHGVKVAEARLGKDKAGKFDGLSITINSDIDLEESAFYLAHSMGSIVHWAVATAEAHSTYAELRSAKKRREAEPEAFERGLKRFCDFEETASEYAVWLLTEIGNADSVAPYTTFARADLDAIVEFHRTGEAPLWPEFFARWKEDAKRGRKVVKPYQPRAIPRFQPIKIETQEIVQEKK